MKNRFNPAKRWFKNMALILIITIMANQLHGCGYTGEPVQTAQTELNEEKRKEQEEKAAEAVLKTSFLAEGTEEIQSAMENLSEKVSQGKIKEAEKLAGELSLKLSQAEEETKEWLDAGKNAGVFLSEEAQRLLAERADAFYGEWDIRQGEAEETLAVLQNALSEGDAKEAGRQMGLLMELLCEKETPKTYGDGFPSEMPEPVIGNIEADGKGVSQNHAGRDGAEVPQTEEPDESFLILEDETALPEDMKEIADALSTPLAVYNYLKSNVNTEYYYGSRKGAAATWDAMGGNDMDQASLLAAMLRYLDCPAEYVRGTVELTGDQALSMTGAQTMEQAAYILASCGGKVMTVSDGDAIQSIRMEHVWVRAFVPYTDYRGAGKAAGKSVWVDLDTSVKEYSDVKSIYETIGTDRIKSEMENALKAENAGAAEELIGQWQETLEETGSTDIHSRGRMIKIQEVDYLPLSLQYVVTEEKETFARIKDTDRDSVSFTVNGANLGTYSAQELYGKDVVLSFRPATGADREIFSAYPSIFDVPAYAVNMQPVLVVDGEAVGAAGEEYGTGLGTKQIFTMKIHSSGRETVVDNDVTTGSMYAVTLDAQSITPTELQDVYNETEALKESVSDNNVYSEEHLGKYLSLAGKLYFAQVDIADAVAEELYGVEANRSLSEGITGYEVRTSRMYGMVTGISEGSLYIDVDADVHGVVSLKGGKQNEKDYMASTGMLSSLYESLVWEQLTGMESVSTISILQTAEEQGIEILILTKENLSTGLGKLHTDAVTRENVINAVNSGKTVTIPAENVRIKDWNGTGYIVMNMETGAGEYLISGGLSGGAVTGIVTTGEVVVVTVGVAAAVKWCMIGMQMLIASFQSGTLFLTGMGEMAVIVAAAMVALMECYHAMMVAYVDYLCTGDLDSAAEVLRFGEESGWQLLLVGLAGKYFEAAEEYGQASAGAQGGGGTSGRITVVVDGQTIVLDKPSDAWKLDPKVRGKVIEEILAQTEYKDAWHCGAENGGYFPAVDFQEDMQAVSLKTIDPSLPSYQNGGGTSKIIKYIEALCRNIKIEGVPLSKVLDVRIPEGTGGYLDKNEIYRKAVDVGVKVIIKEF